MSKQFKANCMLVLTAMIWGAAFVAQSVGMDYVGPFTFLMARSFLGGLVLLPVIAWMNRGKPAAAKTSGSRRDYLLAGLLCGTALFAGSAFQQLGLLYTSAGKSGFITALYVVLVPICSLFLGKRVGLNMWISVVIASVSLYLLCINESFTIGPGELLTLICALCFTSAASARLSVSPLPYSFRSISTSAFTTSFMERDLGKIHFPGKNLAPNNISHHQTPSSLPSAPFHQQKTFTSFSPIPKTRSVLHLELPENSLSFRFLH